MLQKKVKWGQELYKWGTLGVATAVAISVSLACSFWFFFSLMGGEGPQAIGAGIAGCTLQIFGYGFAASFLKVNPLARFMLCAMPLALSMFSSYSAIYGFLSHEQEAKSGQNKKTEMVYQMLEQSAADKKTASEAASNGIKGKYKSMGKDLLASNERAMERDMQLLEKIDDPEPSSKASPLDGLVKVTGDASMTTILFCAWLAVLFDLLPVVAISVLSNSTRRKLIDESLGMDVEVTETVHTDLKNNTVDTEIAVHAQAQIQHEEQTQELDQVHVEQVEPTQSIEDKPAVKSQNKAAKQSDGDYEETILKLRQGMFEATYTGYSEFTGRSKWQAQNFFKRAQEDGYVKKSGRAFEVVDPLTNVSMLPNAAQAVTA
ncbi:hypothetical protein R50073_50140 (plasmid) [Maricurvus nonylphenolicus]|uniref:hypothetical protein n=1 Tax=Maricurvus nonylphenolicus TaxID=1008307 RepID=UPI0036F3EA14